MGGGNSHQRAIQREKQRHLREEGEQRLKNLQPRPAVESNDRPPTDAPREWKQPLNRADSIGLLGILLGTFFVLIVPTVWYKVAAFVLLCFGVGYFIWLSHWTYRLDKLWRVVLSVVVILPLIAGAFPQFAGQWRMEHLRSNLMFDARIPGFAYPDGDHYGIEWSKTFVEVRLIVTSKEKVPIQNLNLSVWPINRPGQLAGMAQTNSEPQGCVIRRPREPFPIGPVIFLGNDGSRADISPLMGDMWNVNWPIRDHYDLLCQRILAGESIPLVMAVIPQDGKEGATIASSQLRIKGDYETTPAEGSKRVLVDAVVSIATLPRWR